MSDLKFYIEKFFDELEVYEDKANGHCYKIYMKQAILAFLKSQTKESAFEVYRAFFDSYRITIPGDKNPFLDILDLLKDYEENAAILTEKQRDHYIHSVNVFVLGLAVFASNEKYRKAFSKSILENPIYTNCYSTKNEEFFYRWGITSLFHDIGYPVEIAGKQLNEFISMTSDVSEQRKTRVEIDFSDFDALNSIPEILPKKEFTKCFYEKYDDCLNIDMLKPLDLLAHRLSEALGADLMKIKSSLDDFIEVMAKCGFVDHGFYSSIIILKWYGYLVQKANYNPEYFFWPILDSASAILMHNFYRGTLSKKPGAKEPGKFDLPALKAEQHPLAYLIMLCDELQEWNRQPYGKVDKMKVLADDVIIDLGESTLAIQYISHKGHLGEKYITDKHELFAQLIDVPSMFDEFNLTTHFDKENTLPIEIKKAVTRPLLSDLEKLAKVINDDYENLQVARGNKKESEIISFEDLSEDLKYSNLRQAMEIFRKIDLMGYQVVEKGVDGEITEIPKAYVEALAKIEHDSWCEERLASGWVLDKTLEKADRVNRRSPYLVPYEELPESIKDLDRDTIINIPHLLGLIGKALQ